MKIVLSILICALLAFAASEELSSSSKGKGSKNNIQLELFSGSNQYWIAVSVQNANADTSKVQIMDSSSNSWSSMDYTSGWGYWTFSSLSKLNFPLSFRLTSVNGDQITVSNKVRSLDAGAIDTAAQYSSAAAPTDAPAPQPTAAATNKGRPTQAPTSRPTAAPTKAPTAAPTKAATTAPTKAPATAAPTTKAPATAAPTTKAAATAAPTTKAPATAAPTTKAAANAPSSGCSAPIKMMVPLYTYPGASWDAVAAGGRLVPTVAIINPNSGPGNGPDSSYKSYMTKLHNAGVEIVGYVHTSWGARPIADVKKDIDVYAAQFPLLSGIFLDEGAATADQVPYYTQLYNYIMGMPGWKYDIINPGAVPTSGYLNIATQIVSFEDSSTKFAASANPSYASCSNKDKFAVITYGATSASTMQAAFNSAKSKGYYGWVYVTDGAGGCCTYNALSSYYAASATYLASIN